VERNAKKNAARTFKAVERTKKAFTENRIAAELLILELPLGTQCPSQSSVLSSFFNRFSEDFPFSVGA
jgi:hypothetical protein